MKTQNTLLVIAFLLSVMSCKKESDLTGQKSMTQTASSADEVFKAAGLKNHIDIKLSDFFVSKIDNPYFPLTPGTVFHYINKIKEDGETTKEHITVTVTYDTKKILGVDCRIVHDQVLVNGKVSEDTYDWYAQDRFGNIWYFGEDTKSYHHGHVDSAGSFEAGVNGALPGIIMLAHPEKHVGLQYYQEFDPGNAIDQATVKSLDGHADVAYGTFDNCLVTEEYTALEPDVLENKYYSAGLGQVLTVLTVGGYEREELTSITYY